MKTRRVVGPNDISVEVWKCLGHTSVVWLTKLFKKIIVTRKMLDE